MFTRAIGDEQGNAAVEGAIYTAGLLLLLSLIILGGKVALAHQAVAHVASEAARTASLQRSAGAADTAAQSEAAATLAAQHLTCEESSTVLDTSGFGAALGQKASVSATTTCRLSLGSLAGGGTITVKATASSPLDEYRAR